MSSRAYNYAIKKMSSSSDIEYVEIADMDTDDDDDDVDDVKEEDRTLDFSISKLREHISRLIYSVLSFVKPLISLVFAGRTFGLVIKCS